jgi:hypothetical protein
MKEKTLTSNGQMKEGYMVGRMVKWTNDRGVHCQGNVLMGHNVNIQMLEGALVDYFRMKFHTSHFF